MNIVTYTKEKYSEVKNILIDAGRFDDVWDSEAHWQRKITENKDSILLAMEGDDVVGCIVIIQDEWTSFLFRLAVKKSCRGKGVGSALLEVAENYLKKCSTDEVAMFVDADDKELHEYYEKRGYQKGGVYRCMYKKLI